MADYPARPESSSRSLDASGSAGELLVHTVSHREVRVVRCGRPGCTPALGQPQAGAGGQINALAWDMRASGEAVN